MASAGSIQQTGKNSWKLTVSGGFDGSGKRIRHTKTVRCTSEQQARKELAMFVAQIENGQLASTAKLKVKDFALEWFERHSKTLAPKTQRTYKYHLDKRIITFLGGLDIAKLKPIHIMDFIDALQKNTSPDTTIYCYRVLSSMLTDAVQWQVIPFNPCDRVKPPVAKKIKAANNFYDEEQSQLLLNALETEPFKHQLTILLAITTGLRLGELCGLEWKDLNFQQGLLTVNRASQSLAGLGTFSKRTKNMPSNRTITLPANLIALLLDFKAAQDIERIQLGDKWSNSDRLLVRWNGQPVYATSPSQWFQKFLKRYNLKIDLDDKLSDEDKTRLKLPRIRFHDLRHTCASLLIAKGIPLKNVSTQMGHGDVRTTGNRYGHPLSSIDKQIANTMNDIMFKNRKKAVKKEQA